VLKKSEETNEKELYLRFLSQWKNGCSNQSYVKFEFNEKEEQRMARRNSRVIVEDDKVQVRETPYGNILVNIGETTILVDLAGTVCAMISRDIMEKICENLITDNICVDCRFKKLIEFDSIMQSAR